MENNMIFQKLTPTDNVEMEVYEEAFNYIFENKDIKNVAVSGPYSAGKSSLLESYKKIHTNKKFLHISLAHFEKTDFQKAEEDVKDMETVLEGKILNQLIQQIKVENIPQTNFRVKRTVSNIRCLIYSIDIIVFILAVLHLQYFRVWTDWIALLADSRLKDLLRIFADPYSLLFSGAVAMTMLGAGVYQLIKAQKNKNIFRKLSVQGNEIEIFGEDKDSYFDKYLNEVLYLFENSGYDVIVFEDLDRYDDNKIFERLREINILSNIRLQHRKNKKDFEPLRFFYLLRDDIFVNKDRTKFFDFILSVVPVLDSSNAYDQIKAHFEKGGIFAIFEEKFLRGLSLYIDDMRVLKNIYNEFMIYYNKLNTIELNPNKMLAMITYKNIFPRDFSELQLNQGFVFELFNRREEFIIQEKKKYAKSIEINELQINNIKNEELKSVEELNHLNNAYYDKYYRYGRYSEYKEWEKNEYPMRKKAIEDKTQNKMGELEKELSILQEEIHILENKTLHEIITRENIDEIFRITSENEIGNINEYKEIKGSEYFSLLKYLIRHGYIDESYNDYMTFFYENSLTKRDKMFLRSVRDKVAKPFSYALDNVSLVMSNLDVYDFEQEETLNYDLFEYLLQNRTKQDILLCFVKQLKNERRYSFVSGFFETKREKANLVMTINNQWSGFFEEVLSGQKMSARQIQDYSVATLKYTEAVDLSNVNMNNCLTEYISSQQEYLAIENPDITKLCKEMKGLGVAFKRIAYQASNKDLFDAVYQNDLYEINIENVCLMLETEYHIKNIKDVSKQYVSFVFSRPEQPLYKYIQKNIDIFMESILGSSVEEFTDKSVDAVMIINNIGISEENKLAYIERLKTRIDILGNIDEVKYQTELMVKMGVQYSAENILEYFEKAGMTDDLVEFIDSEKSYLDYCNNEIYNSELIIDFWNQCILSKKLSLQKFKEILLNIKPVYTEFDTLGVPNDKMRILIKEKIIPMTNATLAFMRENFQDIRMEYIVNNISEYVNIATGSMASAEEVESILLYDIADELKIELLSEISDEISVVDQNYSDRITAYVLANNLNKSDVSVLYKNYRDFGLEVQQVILKIAKRNIDQIIDEPQDVCRDIIVELIKDTSIDKNERINLFIMMIKEMTSEECIQYFNVLGMPQFVKIFEQNKRPKIPINTLNQKILTALKRAGFINDFSTDEENGVYKQFRRGAIQSKIPDVLL